MPGLVAFPRLREFERNGVRLHFGRIAFSTIFVCCAAAPAVVRFDQLFDLLWGDAENGGPLGPREVVGVSLRQCARDVQALGLSLRASTGPGNRGRRLGGYIAFDTQRTAGGRTSGPGGLECAGSRLLEQARLRLRTVHLFEPGARWHAAARLSQ